MSGLKLCAMFFKDGEEEMMTNASCFHNYAILKFYYLQIVSYIFSKRQVSQTPYLYNRVSLI